MRKTFALVMTVFMTLTTTALLILAFAVLPFTRTNMIFITGVCSIGYLATFLYLDIYRKSKP